MRRFAQLAYLLLENLLAIWGVGEGRRETPQLVFSPLPSESMLADGVNMYTTVWLDASVGGL